MSLQSASSANELTIRLPRRHPAQERVVTEAQRFNVLACGRRWGKTALGLDILTTEPRGALDGYPVGWFAPNEKYFDEVWAEANRVLRAVIRRADTQKKRLDLITGGTIQFWTLHNTDDPGRGRAYSKVVIDEAAVVPTKRLSKQWPEAIRPTLTDYAGEAWFLSTPQGADYFKTLYDRHQQGEAGWMAWQMPTIENPFIDPGEVENARLDLAPLAFAQEYQAQFVSEIGGKFKQPARYEPDQLPRDDFEEATGCDFAYTSKAGDWTVFLRGRKRGEQIYVTDLYREQVEINEWMERLKLEPRPFALIGGQEKGITQLLSRYDVSIKTQPAAADKLARAQPAIAAWNRGDIKIPTDAPWLDDLMPEIMSFTGDPRVDAHDDIVDALAALHHELMGARPRTDIGVRGMASSSTWR